MNTRRNRGLATLLAVLILTLVAGAIAAGVGLIRYDFQRTQRLQREAQANLLLTAAMVGGQTLTLPDDRGTVTVQRQTDPKSGQELFDAEVTIDGLMRRASWTH